MPHSHTLSHSAARGVRRLMPPLALYVALLSTVLTASAQALAPTSSAQPTPRLADAFALAWATHPAAQSGPARRAWLGASRQAAEAWTAQPPALEVRTQTDRPGSDRGAQELEIGVVLPLWRSGQRSRSQALAAQAEQAFDARLAHQRLALAGQVREAWWAWQRACAELDLASQQVALAQALANDVHRRVRAGELARADAHQAEGALALAQSAQALAEGQSLLARQALQALLGGAWPWPRNTDVEPTGAEPLPAEGAPELGRHPQVRDLEEQALAARQAAELADTQSLANPELMLGTVQSRDARGEPRQRQLTLGLRLPWGESPAQRAEAARAHAEATELSVLATRQRELAQTAIATAQARWRVAQRVHEAAQRRATLARESQGFFDKSFRLGETDLPTRLRIAQEAQEATRQATLAAIDVAAATSAWRQAAGLLPE